MTDQDQHTDNSHILLLEDLEDLVENANERHENIKYQPLEQALEGQPEIIKNRVYRLIIHWGIEPENEFFIIFIAMGQLLALVEEAPKKFDTSFENFTEGINLWTETNIQILNEIATKAKITEQLAGGAEKLAQSSSQLVQVCSELIVQLKKSNLSQINSQSPPLTLKESYENSSLQKINNKLLEIEKLIFNLQKSKTEVSSIPNLLPKKTKQIWSINSVFFWILLLVSCTFVIFNWRSINQIDQRTNWLLEKANRQECLQGIKSSESLECKSLPSN